MSAHDPPDRAAAEPPLILAVDVGSSSARTLLYDRLGRVVRGVGAQEPYAFTTTAEGAAETDADALLARVERCIDGALAQAGALASEIAAVAVATFATSTLAVDGAGRPLTPLLPYADMRNEGDAATLRHHFDETAVHERTGCLLRAGYWPARLAWFRRTQPQLRHEAARWITLGEYLELRLFGRARVSLSVASWGGLLDRHRLAWDGPLLEHLGLAPEQLSSLVDLDEPLAGLLPTYAERWPALRSIPWLPAVGDGAAANVGTGCTGPDRIALTIGTTGAVRAVQAEVAQVPPGLWCYRVDRQRGLLGGATSEGGNLYAWLRETLRLGEAWEIEAALAACPPDGHGLTVLPFAAGERSPGWAGNVGATIQGMTLATTPIAILRAGLEAVAYRFALIERRLCAQTGSDHRLIASGHALLASPAWMQIMADAIGKPVAASAEAEASSRGAALLALESIGALPSIAAAPTLDGAVYEPDAARHQLYQAAIERQGELYRKLIG